tara:strand:- start:3328 stop:3516 length:189 start_codon:yes stop_codon:yes gene_type:complete
MDYIECIDNYGCEFLKVGMIYCVEETEPDELFYKAGYGRGEYFKVSKKRFKVVFVKKWDFKK